MIISNIIMFCTRRMGKKLSGTIKLRKDVRNTRITMVDNAFGPEALGERTNVTWTCHLPYDSYVPLLKYR